MPWDEKREKIVLPNAADQEPGYPYPPISHPPSLTVFANPLPERVGLLIIKILEELKEVHSILVR